MAEAAPVGTDADQDANLEMLISRAAERIDGQSDTLTSTDAKALGMLALDAAAIALLVTVSPSIRGWWLPVIGLAISGAFLVRAIWPGEFNRGPNLRKFYDEWGLGRRRDTGRNMLAQLLLAIDENAEMISPRGTALKRGIRVFLVAFVVGVIVAVTAIH